MIRTSSSGERDYENSNTKQRQIHLQHCLKLPTYDTTQVPIDRQVDKKTVVIFSFVEQNITRAVEVKINLTIARGEWGGDSGERGL